MSNELWFADLDKTCAKQRARVCSCWKMVPNHTVQLFFCFNLVRIINDLRHVQETVRNCPIAQNWRQKILRKYRLACNLLHCVKKLKIVKNIARNSK